MIFVMCLSEDVVCIGGSTVDAARHLDRAVGGTKDDSLGRSVVVSDYHTVTVCIVGRNRDLAIDLTSGSGIVLDITHVADKAADATGKVALDDKLTASSTAGDGVTLGMESAE